MNIVQYLGYLKKNYTIGYKFENILTKIIRFFNKNHRKSRLKHEKFQKKLVVVPTRFELVIPSL